MTFIDENKGVIALVIVMLAVGSLAYLTFGSTSMFGNEKLNGLFDGSRLKLAFDSDGSMVIFANVKNNEIANLDAMKGNPIPEEYSMVLGNSQEKIIPKTNYFGINTTVEGVLEKTDSFVDEIQFLSLRQFEQVSGEEGRVFTKNAEGVPKAFFTLGFNSNKPPKFVLSEGDMAGYQAHNLDGTVYYPLILGAKEAKVMRDENMFKKTGDPIRNFFGRNFVVVGVLEETNTTIDRMHFVPFTNSEMG